MATTSITQGFNVLRDSMNSSSIAGIDYVIPLILVFLTLVFVTRDLEEWKTLAFPILLMWGLAGIDVPLIFNALLGIQFVLTIIGIQRLGNVLGAVFTKPDVTASLRKDIRAEKVRQQATKINDRLAKAGKTKGFIGEKPTFISLNKLFGGKK